MREGLHPNAAYCAARSNLRKQGAGFHSFSRLINIAPKIGGVCVMHFTPLVKQFCQFNQTAQNRNEPTFSLANGRPEIFRQLRPQ